MDMGMQRCRLCGRAGVHVPHRPRDIGEGLCEADPRALGVARRVAIARHAQLALLVARTRQRAVDALACRRVRHPTAHGAVPLDAVWPVDQEFTLDATRHPLLLTVLDVKVPLDLVPGHASARACIACMPENHQKRHMRSAFKSAPARDLDAAYMMHAKQKHIIWTMKSGTKSCRSAREMARAMSTAPL